MRFITIQGNIGSGKSTLVKYMKETVKNPDIYFMEEPVNEWLEFKNSEGNNIIQEFYKDKPKYAFSFQVMALLTKINKIKLAKNSGYKIILSERSIETDKNVFAKMLYDEKCISDIDYQIFNSLYKELAEDYREEIVYLKTSPEVCYERVEKRKRPGENELSIDYLNVCHKYHETWLNEKDILCINGDSDIESNPTIHQSWANQIYNKLFD